MVNIVKHKNKVALRKNLKRLAIAFAIVLFATGLYITYLQPNTLEAKQRLQLESTQSRLIETQVKLQHQETKSQKEAKANAKKLQEVQKKLKETQRKLQAKREANAAVAAVPAPEPVVRPQVAVSGTCSDWIRAAGIGDVANAVDLINRESGCNPNAVNPSSGACGVAQELPCGKSGCSMGDGACQVRWMNSYVIGRYGSWAGAIAWHNAHNWY